MSYIGVLPNTPDLLVYRYYATATQGQTSVTVRAYTAGQTDLYVNGVKYLEGDDFTATDGTTINFTVALNAGDSVEVKTYESFRVADQVVMQRFEFVATSAGQTFTGLNYTVGNIQVSRNGFSLPTTEYSAGDGITVTVPAAVNGDEIIVTAWKTFTVADHYTKAESDVNLAAGLANLVDSSPATLDTLNELASALGDDPNFATTVTNSIADKAPKVVSHIDMASGGGGSSSLTALQRAKRERAYASASSRGNWVKSAIHGNGNQYSMLYSSSANNPIQWTYQTHEDINLAVSIRWGNFADTISRNVVLEYTTDGGENWTVLQNSNYTSGSVLLSGNISVPADYTVKVRTRLTNGGGSILIGVYQVVITSDGHSRSVAEIG